jgi:predicted short-subunit dehydrogenase-like oxidoreductase (DUF2520 family)
VKKATIAIVGIGRLGTGLARRLAEAGYTVSKFHARTELRPNQLTADVIWFCVPDAEIERVAEKLSQANWKGRYAFHSSGVLSSDRLYRLRGAGAHVASVHPLMTFVKGSMPELKDVPFAIEGDSAAVRAAREIVRDLGSKAVAIRKQDKVAYHAFATMICPLLIALLAGSEKAAALAGISERDARRRMMPIVWQTLRNYEKLGAAGSSSGPFVRGDAETIRQHLKILGKVPDVRNVYIALARAASNSLAMPSRRTIAKLLDS